MTRPRILAAIALLLASTGCELVAGIGDRTVSNDGASGSGGSDAGGSPGQGGTGGVSAGGHPEGGTSGASGQGGAAAGSSGAVGAGGDAGGNAGGGNSGTGGVGGQVTGGQGGSAGSGGRAGEAGAAGASGGEAGTAGAGGNEGPGGNGGAGASGGQAGAGGSAGSAGASGSAGAGGGSTTCALTQTTTTGVRVANLVPGTEKVDFCFKPKAAADYTGIAPLLRGTSANCPTGFAYKQVSTSFDVAPGIYEAKVISDSATDCTDAGIATLASVVAKTGARTDVFFLGTSAMPSLATYLESTPMQFEAALRFLPAALDAGPLDVGVTDNTELPATFITPVFSNVTFPSPPTSSGFGTVDAAGYLQTNLAGASVNVGVAPAGATDAALLRVTPFISGNESTLFLVGTAADPHYPEELLFCNELVADQQYKYLAECNGGSSSAAQLSVGTFNTQQTGVFVIDGAERLQPSIDALANADTDVLCVSELWDEPTRQALLTAAKANFPYQVEFQSDLTTPTDDPTDQMGKVPAAFTTPACNLAASVTKLNKLVDCARDSCSTAMGDEQAIALPGQCLATTCQAPFAALVLSDSSCYSCALTHLQSYQTMATTRSECATNPAARFAYNGNNGSLILSKLPIKSSGHVLFPSTEWRVAALRADVTLSTPSGDATVDVYCSCLTTPPGDALTRPYVGQYGNGLSKGAAWAAENQLQAQKLIDLVKKNSTGRHAVVIGEFYSGPDYNDGTTQVLSAVNPMTFQTLLGSFAPGVAPDYTPACTYCSTNPLVGGMTDEWESHVFLRGIAVTDVLSTSRRFTDPVVSVTSGMPPMTTMVPLSAHYGIRSVISVRP